MIFLRWRRGEIVRKTGVYLSVNEDFEDKFDKVYAQKDLDAEVSITILSTALTQ
jgi:hypothetical protein